MSPPDQAIQQFEQAIGSDVGDVIRQYFSSNLKLNIPQGANAGAESLARGEMPPGATTPAAANVKIVDSFNTGDRAVIRFQYDVKGADVEGGSSGTTTLTALCVARIENGKVVEATLEYDTSALSAGSGSGSGGGGRLASSASGRTAQAAGSSGDAEQLAQQFSKALQSGDVSNLTALFADDLNHDLDRSGIQTSLGEASQLADVARYAKDANIKILDQVVKGDQIVARFQYDVNGDNVPGATKGSRATVTAVAIARVQNGRISEVNIEQDTAGIYLQLGLGIADSRTS